MKKRHLLIAIALLSIGFCTTEVHAQENIKAMIKKCEGMDEVIEADIVRYNDPRIKKLSRSTILIKMIASPELEQQLEEAFRKDSPKATHAVEQKKEGKISHMLYRFDSSTYSFTVSNDTISIQARESNPIIRFR